MTHAEIIDGWYRLVESAKDDVSLIDRVLKGYEWLRKNLTKKEFNEYVKDDELIKNLKSRQKMDELQQFLDGKTTTFGSQLVRSSRWATNSSRERCSKEIFFVSMRSASTGQASAQRPQNTQVR